MYKELSEQIYEKFVFNNNAAGVQTDEGYYLSKKVPVSPMLIEQMLLKKKSLGTYQQQTYSEILKWICFDFDCKKEYSIKSLMDLKERYLLRFIHRLEEKKIEYLIEFSGRRGFHVWVIFDSAISKNMGYKIVQHLAGDIYNDIIREGSFGLDLFPKTRSRKQKNKYGLMVKVPLSRHKKGTYSYFIQDIENFSGEAITELNKSFIDMQTNCLKNYKYNVVEDVINSLQLKNSEEEKVMQYKREFVLAERSIKYSDLKRVFETDKALNIIWNNIANSCMTRTDRIVMLGCFGHVSGGDKLLLDIFRRQQNYDEKITMKEINANRNFYFPISMQYLYSMYGIDADQTGRDVYVIDYILDGLNIENKSFRMQIQKKQTNEVLSIINKELNYISYNDEVPAVDIINELRNMTFYDIKEIENYSKDVICGNKSIPDKIHYKIYNRKELEKERMLISFFGKERVITTFLGYKLMEYLQRNYKSYSYHLNISYGGDVFFPWITSWKRFKRDVGQFFSIELFEDFHFIKLDFKNFYGNIYLQTMQSKLIKLAEQKGNYVSEIKNIYNYLTTINDRVMIECANTIRGVPQGPAYARILAELTVDILDEEFWKNYNMYEGHMKIYRYVDDMYIFHDDEIDSESFLKNYASHFEQYGLFLNKEKTQIYGKIKDMPLEDKEEMREMDKFMYEVYNIKDYEVNCDQEFLEYQEKYSRYLYRKDDWDINDVNFILSSHISLELKKIYIEKYYERIIYSEIGRGSVFGKFYTFILTKPDALFYFLERENYKKIPINSINFKNFINVIFYVVMTQNYMSEVKKMMQKMTLYYLKMDVIDNDEHLMLTVLNNYLEVQEDEKC